MHENICEWVCEKLVGEIVMINGCWSKNIYVVVLWIIGLRICDDNMMLDGWFE
jgi:hypothetical protein